MQKSKTYICQNFRIVFQFIISGIEAEERKPEIIKGTEREREREREKRLSCDRKRLELEKKKPKRVAPPLSASSMPHSVEDRTPLLSPDVSAEVILANIFCFSAHVFPP